MQDLEQLRDELLAAVSAAADPDALDTVRVSALGRKGRITELMKGLGALDVRRMESWVPGWRISAAPRARSLTP